MKRILAVGVILLFLGVAIAPSINQSVVRASPDDDLVEVTTQACGIQGYKDSTVKLTREQYQNLEQYLVEFRARLNQTTTREEAVPIFKEAVVELNKYGLLGGLSVERAQKLVTSGYQNYYRFQHLKKSDRNTLNQTELSNKFCLIAGYTNNYNFIGPGLIIITLIWSLFILILYSLIGFEVDIAFPFQIGGVGTFGYAVLNDYYEFVFVPSDGWVYSRGSQGAQSVNGSFYGTIDVFQWLWTVRIYIGVTGFIGLIIGNSNTSYFLGSAYRIGLSTNHS
ncbi:MAG: hypothetical protein WC525_01410 [Candidatus Thermoplasmatota archaeon]